VVEMRRWTAIRGSATHSPRIALPTARIHHRFDGDDHAFLQTRSASRFPVIRKVRFIVHLRSDAVPHKLRTTEKPFCSPSLHRVPDIAQPLPGRICRSRDPATRGSHPGASAAPADFPTAR